MLCHYRRSARVPALTQIHPAMYLQFKKPCILDLKMGTQTYPEGATPEKIAREEAKYPPQKEIGFRFVGLTVCAGEGSIGSFFFVHVCFRWG